MSLLEAKLTRYVKAIRNPSKKLYACQYWEFLRGKRPSKPTYLGESIMARDAVERELEAISKIVS